MINAYFEYGQQEINHLRKKDKKLGAAIDRIGIIQRRVNPDVFAALVESIVAQQISTKAAATVNSRLTALCGADFAGLHGLAVQEIQACGMSTRKAGYIKGIAEAAASGAIDFAALHKMTDQEIIKTLTVLSGVGLWTAEMLLIFSLSRPNVVSYGDLAIRRGMMRLYGLTDLPKDKFARYAKRYAPYGSVASLYLWEIYGQEV
ncbi:MAG: DNA-3-methyladenine glycosylase [Defluviitaleaceae bacterium]|nr:DNA-3-methyladenine glycosylase [Defluviitaleaceae bacterium]